MAAAFRDDSSWAYNHKPQEDVHNMLASTATTIKRPPTLSDQTSDALTGLLLTSPTKKARTGAGNAVAGYSPELTKALKSVVKIFTTMARYALCTHAISAPMPLQHNTLNLQLLEQL